MTNGLSNRYHLGEFTFIFRGIRSGFKLLFTVSMNFQANRIAPDRTPRSAASHLELYCSPISQFPVIYDTINNVLIVLFLNSEGVFRYFPFIIMLIM